jgi:hypothetical protein
MVGRVSETARATQWACAAASTMTTDRIMMLRMTATEIKPRICENTDSESVLYDSHLYCTSTLNASSTNGILVV